jgi:hypothetical protein
MLIATVEEADRLSSGKSSRFPTSTWASELFTIFYVVFFFRR